MAVEIVEKPTQKDIDANNNEKNQSLGAFQKLSKDLLEDERILKEFTLGKRIGFYRMRGDLGSGNFAKVKLGYHCLAKEKVAIKILDKNKLDEKTQKMLTREISCMERLQHPNLIRMFEVLETVDNLYMILEYASCGELFQKIVNQGKFSESISRCYFSQLLSAVQHMHQRNIVHRDIKAENVFLHINGTLKLGDLGFSTIVPTIEQQLNTFCGSPPYAAPELFKDDYYYGNSVDVWALGVLLFFMVTGTMPFRADTVGKLKRKILEGVFVVPDYVSESCRFLICQILRPVPGDRFSIPEIMRSVWLEGSTYPKQLTSSLLKPNADQNACQTDEEVEAMNQLRSYGVTEEMIAGCPDSSRNNINGIFRLAVYQAQKRKIEKQREKELQLKQQAEEKLKQSKLNRNKAGTQASGGGKNQQSKFCLLL